MKNLKTVLIWIGSILLFFAAAIIFLNWYIKKELQDALENDVGSTALQYEDLSLNVLTARASLTAVVFHEGGIKIEVEKVNLQSLSYSDYISDGRIVIENLVITNPQITITKSDSQDEDAEEGGEPVQQNIQIKKVTINNGHLQLRENDTTSNTLFVSLHQLVLDNVTYNKEPTGQLLPFEYRALSMESDSLFYNMNTYHNLTINSINFEDEILSLNELEITPIYSKAEFNRQISNTKDYVQFTLEDLTMENFQWETHRDTLLFKSTETIIDKADLKLHRNTILPADPGYKPLYSELLRELGIKLQLDLIEIKNSQIVYEEQMVQDRGPGVITFEEVGATIKNIRNVDLHAEDFPETQVEARALFMGQSQLTLNWEFDISNRLEQFTANGYLARIGAEAINPILTPAMNVRTEGEIKSLYYNFYGNNDEARGDMRLEYRDFKVSILREDGEEKRSILSWLANLILINDAINEDVEEEDIHVERIKSKSFWNFLWLCIRDGAFGAFL